MKIFAIDPGTTQSAYCIMDDQYKLYEFAKKENAEIMKIMIDKLDEVDVVVIERIQSYGTNVGNSVFWTCEWIGRFTQEAERKVPVEYIYRKDEKMYLCQTMKANDAMIRRALIDRFAKFDFQNGKGTSKCRDYFYGVKLDCWASISVAVVYLDMRKENGNGHKTV